ncbi:MAG: outer membrane protein/peptidoglycan-associated protein, partial [Mucilaginibacter sp.]|nr:outer membrane protein/peptidoglycan-associated protein [Mucilaginibacter sp.]
MRTVENKSVNPQMASNKKLPAKPLFFQPKLTVNQPNDIYEQEADTMADEVMRMPDGENIKQPFFKPALTITQRKCKNCEDEQKLQNKGLDTLSSEPVKHPDLQRKCQHCEEEEKKVQRKDESGDAGGMTAPSAVHHVINSGGQPLDAGTRAFMESRFNYDFGSVHIHNDPAAHQSSAEINALAYTHGNHVAFGEGQYQPNTNTGKYLLAHELTHVVQQTQASDGALTRKKDNEIQRFIYWSAASPYGKSASGKNAEKVLESKLQESDAEISSQAPIPNANRKGEVGPGIKGFADLYKGKPLKIYFGDAMVRIGSNGETINEPRPIRGKLNKRVSDDGMIGFMADAPKDITIGEIKPADAGHISFGKNQLKSYEKGINFANDQFRLWAGYKGVPDPWNKPTFHRLDTDIPPDYTYNPGSPKTDLNLGVFDFIGDDGGKRSKIKKIQPSSIKINIPGGLYFERAGDGVYIYFYQPADLAA